MIEYLMVNITLSLVAAFTLLLMRRAPARIKLRICLVAVIAWLIPWQSLNIQYRLPKSSIVYEHKIHSMREISKVVQGYLPAAPQTEPRFAQKASTHRRVSNNGKQLRAVAPYIVDMTQIIWGLFGFGLLCLFYRLVCYARMLNAWYRHSLEVPHLRNIVEEMPNNIQIRVLAGDQPGMATGLVSPVIWVGKNVHDADQIRMVLLHELTHIQQHDVRWNFFLFVMRQLFWWNPIVVYFTRIALVYIEKSCDEACVKKTVRKQYIRTLAQMLLDNCSKKKSPSAVQLGYATDLNVERLKSLQMPKVFKKAHSVLMTGTAVFSIIAVIMLAYDSPYVEFEFSHANGESSATVDQIYGLQQWQKPYYDVTTMIQQGQFNQAERALKNLESALPEAGLFFTQEKLLYFKVRAMLLGETARFGEVPPLADRLFTRDVFWKNKEINRILGIAYMQTGNLDAAIKLLGKAKKHKGHRGPTDILFVQSLYLNGQYQAAYEAAQEGLMFVNETYHMRFITKSLNKLLVLSAHQLGKLDIVRQHRAPAGIDPSQSIEDIEVSLPTIPHVYFNYEFVAGQDVEEFDAAAFPLPKRFESSRTPAVQSVLLKLTGAVSQAQYQEAVALIEGELAHSQRLSASDLTILSSLLFLLYLELNEMDRATELAKHLVTMPNVHPPILARAYFTISDVGRWHIANRINYFKRYVGMHVKPNLATDHETIERYYWLSEADEEPARIALERVDRFYTDNDYVPDLRTANRILGMADKLGDTKKVERYAKLIERHYKHSFNFILN